MKTKLLIIIWIVLPLLAYSQVKPEDFKWEWEKRNFRNNFDVSYLKDQKYTFYYLMDNYIKITSNNKDRKLNKVEFENGEVKKISDNFYCITPKKIGRYDLTINDEKESYLVKELPEDKIEFKFSASTSPFPDCISLDELMKSDEIVASYNYNKFKIRFWTVGWVNINSYAGEGSTSGWSSRIDYLKGFLKKNSVFNNEIHFEDVRVFL